MKIQTIIMMALMLSFFLGGFVFMLALAVKKERQKRLKKSSQ